MTPTPRARARLLLRSGRAQPGLVAPLIVDQAAEIEALPLDEFLTNPTKLTKGLTSLHQALGTDAIAVAGGGSTEQVDAAVEATARLVATAPGDPVLAAVLPGPAALAGERGCDLERGGELVLEVVKRFLEAGSHLVVMVEDAAPGTDDWRSAVTPVANVARFHQAVSVVVTGDVASLPYVFVLPDEPKEWTAPPAGTALTITAGVVPGHRSFSEVHEACRRLVGS
jgi:hypothetical protein